MNQAKIAGVTRIMGDKFQDGIRAYQLIASLEAVVKELKGLSQLKKDNPLLSSRHRDELQSYEDKLRALREEIEHLHGFLRDRRAEVKELKLNLAHEEQNVLYGMKDDRREKRRLQDRLDFAVYLLKQSQPDAQSAPSLHGRIKEFLSTITDTKETGGKG